MVPVVEAAVTFFRMASLSREDWADELVDALQSGGHIAATVRIAQGSATVALLTTAGIMAPLVGDLTVHPVYLVMIIGAGGSIFSWYNDSGFWIVKEIGGLTQAETFKIWAALTTIVSLTGFVVVMIMSTLLPFTSV